MNLDGMAVQAEVSLLSRFTQAVELRCDEKAEWITMLSDRQTANYKTDLFESAARSAVGKIEGLDYGARKVRATSIITGDMAAAEITGAVLLHVAENFVQLVEDFAYEASKKSGKDQAKSDDGKKNDKKGKRGGMDALVGEDSDFMSKEFLGALDRDNPLTEKEMFDAVEAHVHGDHERVMLAELKKMPSGKLGVSWTGHNGWKFTKAFIERLARAMLEVNLKRYQGVNVDMGTFRKVTDQGIWQDMARESVQDTSTLFHNQRRIENNLAVRGGRGFMAGVHQQQRGGRGAHQRGGYQRGGVPRGGGRSSATSALTEAQAEFLAAADGNGGVPSSTDAKLKCNRCNGPHNEGDNGGCQQPIFCYNCNKNAGHISKNCPDAPQPKRGRGGRGF